MCGISGIITGGGAFPTIDDWATASVFVGALRGTHSSGIAAITREDKSVVFKSLISGHLVADTNAYQGFLNAYLANTHKPKAALIHNRYATRGGRGIDAAHPLKVGNITLVHNGTLDSNTWASGGFVSDSHELAARISASTDEYARDVFENTLGAFACIWYNENTKNVYFLRNSERPLYYAVVDNGKDGVVVASEDWMLGAGLRSQKFGYSLSPIECDVNRIYSISTEEVYDKKNNRTALLYVKYTAKARPTYAAYYGHTPRFHGYYEDNDPFMEPASTPSNGAAKKVIALPGPGGLLPKAPATASNQTLVLGVGPKEEQDAALHLAVSGAFANVAMPRKGKTTLANINNKNDVIHSGANAMFVLIQAFSPSQDRETITFRGFPLDSDGNAVNPSLPTTFTYSPVLYKARISKVKDAGATPADEAYDYFGELKDMIIKDREFPVIDARVERIMAASQGSLVVIKLDETVVNTVCLLSELLEDRTSALTGGSEDWDDTVPAVSSQSYN